MRILMIRHLPTPGNQRKCYTGKTDESLAMSETIQKMIQEKRHFLETMGQSQVVVSSPMKRCIETAQHLFPGQEVIAYEKLRECDFGEFEGKNYEELKSNPAYQKWLDSGGTLPFPKGESHEMFKTRCIEGFEEVIEARLRKPCTQIAMVLHGGTIMAVLERFAEEQKSFYHWQVENGNGYIATLDEKAWDKGEKVLKELIRI